MKKERIILGIDPGTTATGYGVVKTDGTKTEMLVMGIIDLKKYNDHYTKLKHIFERTLQLIDEFHPDEMALEAPFYGKNVQSMLKLGRAQGVSMAAGLYRSVPIFEYAPRKVKQAITGNGNASKEQVAGMLKSLLNLRELPTQLDASDGLAVAMCHLFKKDVGPDDDKPKTWKAFINQNPKRLG